MELWTEIFVKTVDATWKMDKDFQDHVLIADERRSNQKSQRQYVNSAIRNSRQTRRWFSIKEILVISHPHRRRSEMTELSKEEKDVKIAPTFREVQMKKIKVRIAIGVDEEENVFTYGIGGNTNAKYGLLNEKRIKNINEHISNAYSGKSSK